MLTAAVWEFLMCDLCKQTLVEVGEIRKELTRISSFAHDAKASAEATHHLCHMLVNSVNEIKTTNSEQWENIDTLNAFKSRAVGIWVGITSIFSLIGISIAAVWEAVKHWGH